MHNSLIQSMRSLLNFPDLDPFELTAIQSAATGESFSIAEVSGKNTEKYVLNNGLNYV